MGDVSSYISAPIAKSSRALFMPSRLAVCSTYSASEYRASPSVSQTSEGDAAMTWSPHHCEATRLDELPRVSHRPPLTLAQEQQARRRIGGQRAVGNLRDGQVRPGQRTKLIGKNIDDPRDRAAVFLRGASRAREACKRKCSSPPPVRGKAARRRQQRCLPLPADRRGRYRRSGRRGAAGAGVAAAGALLTPGCGDR